MTKLQLHLEPMTSDLVMQCLEVHAGIDPAVFSMTYWPLYEFSRLQHLYLVTV